jgi:ubiquitin carboxyl-terminal hydrolase 4/11/15
MNNHQQDAMEFISILLNYLHEDLNRVTNKPYLKIGEQKTSENDEEASQRSLDCNLQRDDSIIFDLFNGQFKNIIKCLNCQNIKKTYEPFINISLPIPVQHNFYIIKFFTHLNCKYITMNINSETTLFDLINIAINYLDKEIFDSLKKIQANNSYKNLLLFNSIELVKLNKNKIINEIYSKIENNAQINENYGKNLSSIMENEEEIVLFQKNIIVDNNIKNIYVYPIMTDENNIDKIHFLSYPVVLSVNANITLDSLEKLIFESFKHIIDTKKLKNGNYVIDLNILHSSKNLNKGFFGIIKEYQTCSFCNESYDSKKYCPLYLSLSKSDTILKLCQYSNNSEPLVLLARSYSYDKNKKVYPNDNFEEINMINKYKNIYDSFNSFGSFEDLGGDSLWLCSKCHQRTTIAKAIKIFKPPNYLIIQLKRFKKKSDNFFSILEGDKNKTFVSFPTKNLDLNNYIDGPAKLNAIYNLYAVINHKSMIGFNHFTAFCRNNNRWFEFNDSKVCEISNIITEDAYILFYIKKEIDE